MPDEAGVRIAASAAAPSEGGLQVELVPGPADGDQLVGTNDARVFLDQAAASVLDDKVLDAGVDDQGGAHFNMSPQNPDTVASDS